MAEAAVEQMGGVRRSGWRAAAGGAAALLILLALGALVVHRLVGDERARDTAAWQSRLGLIADGRAVAVTDWIGRQYATVKDIAENQSVQLYMGELAASGGDPSQVPDQSAQASYLRNFLIVTAERTGFLSPRREPAVEANVRRLATAGLLLLDARKRPLVGTPNMPPLAGRLATWIAGVPRGERAMLDMFAGADGAPAMAFLAPVFSVEGGSDASQQIGYVVGVKPVSGELFPLLTPPGPPQPGGETELVRAKGAAVEFLSPLADGTKPMQRLLARNTPDLAEAFAMAQPGGFALKRDYRDRRVLVTSRALPAMPWTLVYKVDRDTALAESDARGVRLAVFGALALAVLAGGLIAVWYYASSRRAAEAAASFRALAERFESQGALLRLVTDSQPTAIFIADDEGRYRFANREATRRAGIAEADLLGKTLEQVLGPAAAARTLQHNREALGSGREVERVEHVERDGAVAVLQSAHIPLPPAPDQPRRVLVVEQDVTAREREREHRVRAMKQLVGALVAAVDRRDRYAADQSQRVAAIAGAIAAEMALAPELVEAAETAGKLMNFGKLLVPPELLTKAGQLSQSEITLVRSSLQATADILAGIEFPGPVVETLRQMRERVDGGGPRGLKGEEILVTARVAAVANAFVAMASPRAYRPVGDVDGALAELLRDVGTAFDRRVVAALVTYLDNHGGRARWSALAAAPAARAQHADA